MHNAHTHLELSNYSALCPQVSIKSFSSWLKRVIELRQSLTDDDYRNSAINGINLVKKLGTTSVYDIASNVAAAKELLSSGLNGIVYLEILGLDPTQALERLDRAKEVIRELQEDFSSSPMKVGLSLHSTYSCHSDLLLSGSSWCAEFGIPLCIHAAESTQEVEFLRENSGQLKELLENISKTKLLSPGLTPIRYLHSLGVLDAKPLIVHALEVDSAEIKLLAEHSCEIAHCPRSNKLLGCKRFKIEEFLSSGASVSLGTDGLVSVCDLDILEELKFAEQIHQEFLVADSLKEYLRS